MYGPRVSRADQSRPNQNGQNTDDEVSALTCQWHRPQPDVQPSRDMANNAWQQMLRVSDRRHPDPQVLMQGKSAPRPA